MIRKIFFSLSLITFACSSFAANKNTSEPLAWSAVKHVVIITLENQPASAAERQPFMQSLISKGGYANNFFAITHPSQPNYISFAAGSLLGVSSNSNVNLDGQHIGDLFDKKCLTWKVYVEDLPNSECYKGTSSGPYARRHEPFISFKSVQNNPAQCKKIRNSREFFTDIAANNLPTFSYYVPNNDNNGHDTSISFADAWLKNTFGPIFNNPQYTKDTLFIVTFDEDDGGQSNKVYTLFLGAGVTPNSKATTRYNIFSLTRTIEDIFALGNMGRDDASATAIQGVWS